MAQPVIWSSQAREELDKIAAYIARDSAQYAAAVVDEFMIAAERLADFPRMGRRVPELDQDTIREILVYSWRAIYVISIDRIEIVDIVHGAQRGKTQTDPD